MKNVNDAIFVVVLIAVAAVAISILAGQAADAVNGIVVGALR
jgi:hypothetical protein